MSIIKSITKGIGTTILVAWIIWMFGWLFSGPDGWPAWVNWLSGGSFVAYMVGLFAWIDYDTTKSIRAKKGKV